MSTQLSKHGILIGIMVLLCFAVMLTHQFTSVLSEDIFLSCGKTVKKSIVILPLEFASNPEEGLAALNLWQVKFINANQDQVFLENVKVQIYLDFIFMFCYVGFFAFFAYYFSKKSGRKIYQFGLALAGLMIIGDAIENWQMLNIIADHNTANYEILNFFTWIKWSGIGLCFLLFATYFFSQRSLSNVVLGLLMLLPFFSWLIVLYLFKWKGNMVEPCHPSYQYGELNFGMIALGLFSLFVYLMGQWRSEKKIQNKSINI